MSQTTCPTLGAGILSWKSDTTLEGTLADHRQRGVFELFDDTLIHFQEVREADIARAQRYGLRWVGSERNRHIGGGFLHLIRQLQTDYVLLLEDDLTFAQPRDELAAMLTDAVALLAAGHMDQFLCRRDDMTRSGYEKFYPVSAFDAANNPQAFALRDAGGSLGRVLRRWMHPHQADKHLAKIVWFEQAPERVRPDVVEKITMPSGDFYVLRGRGTKWANPALLASRRHLLEVFEHVAAQVPGFEHFGYSLERLVNDGPFRDWWVHQNYRMGFTKTLMTRHARKDDGGKIALRDPARD